MALIYTNDYCHLQFSAMKLWDTPAYKIYPEQSLLVLFTLQNFSYTNTVSEFIRKAHLVSGNSKSMIFTLLLNIRTHFLKKNLSVIWLKLYSIRISQMDKYKATSVIWSQVFLDPERPLLLTSYQYCSYPFLWNNPKLFLGIFHFAVSATKQQNVLFHQIHHYLVLA